MNKNIPTGTKRTPEKNREYAKEYYNKNKEKILEKRKTYRDKNHEKVLEIPKTWLEEAAEIKAVRHDTNESSEEETND